VASTSSGAHWSSLGRGGAAPGRAVVLEERYFAWVSPVHRAAPFVSLQPVARGRSEASRMKHSLPCCPWCPSAISATIDELSSAKSGEPERLALVPNGGHIEPWNSPHTGSQPTPRADDRGRGRGETPARSPAASPPARRRVRLTLLDALLRRRRGYLLRSRAPALSISGCGGGTAGSSHDAPPRPPLRRRRQAVGPAPSRCRLPAAGARRRRMVRITCGCTPISRL